MHLAKKQYALYVDINIIAVNLWRRTMHRRKVGSIGASSIALAVMLGTAWHLAAQDAKATYSSMAPLDQYLMGDPGSEIELARSAAPESISRDAEVLVLGRHGYETATQGKNGFVCLSLIHI